jgi:hypothetical protein
MRSALSANGARAKFSVAEAVQSTVLSLPEDFDLTEQQAQALQSDDVIPGASLDLGVFDSGTRIAKARNAAAETRGIVLPLMRDISSGFYPPRWNGIIG